MTIHELRGAKAERDALRARLRRRIREFEERGMLGVSTQYRLELDWLHERAKRYRARKGGLEPKARTRSPSK